VKRRFVCPRCQHGVDLYVTPKVTPVCSCKRGGRVTTMIEDVEMGEDE
jgi:hypothetical protein